MAIPLTTLEKISDGARSSLLKWTAAGGTLVVYDVGQPAHESSDLARLLDLAHRPPAQRSWQPADPTRHRKIVIIGGQQFYAEDETTRPQVFRGARVVMGAENADADAAKEAAEANTPVWPVTPEAFSRLDLLAGQVCAFPGNPFPGFPGRLGVVARFFAP